MLVVLPVIELTGPAVPAAATLYPPSWSARKSKALCGHRPKRNDETAEEHDCTRHQDINTEAYGSTMALLQRSVSWSQAYLGLFTVLCKVIIAVTVWLSRHWNRDSLRGASLMLRCCELS